MKIAIGVNTYKPDDQLNVRQKLCLNSLYDLKETYSDTVQLVNLQFKDEPYPHYPNFDTTLFLERTSKNFVINPVKKLPMTLDVFNLLAEQNCDYFVFLNDDIIVLSDFVEFVKSNTVYDCFIGSRMDIEPIESIRDDFKFKSYNIHGFDVFCISTKWWLTYRKYFPIFIIGRYYWDVYYYSLCKVFGKTKTLNDYPPMFLHPIHSAESITNDYEHQFNEMQAKNIFLQLWFANVNYNLNNRRDFNGIPNCIQTTHEEKNIDSFYKTFYEKNISHLCR